MATWRSWQSVVAACDVWGISSCLLCVTHAVDPRVRCTLRLTNAGIASGAGSSYHLPLGQAPYFRIVFSMAAKQAFQSPGLFPMTDQHCQTD